jgi:predicted nucleotidyltransferase
MEVIMNVFIDGLVNELHGCRFQDFCADNNVKLALLFGSVVQGKMRSDSDIDLALLIEKSYFPRESFLRGRLKRRMIRELSALLRTSLLDLVILNQASPFLRHQVARACEVLYEKSPGDFADYASLALRQHNDARLFYELEAAYLANSQKQSDEDKKLQAGE